MSKLWQALYQTISEDSAPIVAESIREIETLPGLENWAPKQQSWAEAMKIINWGFPLVWVNKLESLDPLRASFAKSIASVGEPDPNVYSEVSAGGLLAALKATKLRYVKTESTRTPDYEASWDDEQIVEIEVTRAAQKLAHVERHKLAGSIVEEIHEMNHPWDVIVHMADKLSDGLAIRISIPQCSTSMSPPKTYTARR